MATASVTVRSGRRRLFYVSLVTAAAVIIGNAAGLRAAYDGFLLTFPIFNTGNGFSNAWTIGGVSAFSAGYTTTEASLAFAGVQTSGGAVVGKPFGAINGAVRTLDQALGADNTTAYVSVLVQPRGTLNAGAFNGFFGLTLSSNLGREIFIGKPGGGATTQYVIEERGGVNQVPSGTPTVVGKTQLLVLKAEFFAGSDVFTLYTDAVPGQPEPTGGAMQTGVDLGTLTKLGIYSTGAFVIDEIRTGPTFESVTPRVVFAGTPGAPNCYGDSMASLAQTYGGSAQSATALGFATVTALEAAVADYCTP